MVVVLTKKYKFGRINQGVGLEEKDTLFTNYYLKNVLKLQHDRKTKRQNMVLVKLLQMQK